MSSSRSWSRRVRLHRASVEAVRAVTVIAVLPLDAQERLAAGSVVGAYLREEGIDWEAHGDVALGVISGVIQLSLQSRSGRERPVLWLGVGQLVELKVPGWGPPNATVATVVSPEATFVLIPLIPFWQERRSLPSAKRSSAWPRKGLLNSTVGSTGSSSFSRMD